MDTGRFCFLSLETLIVRRLFSLDPLSSKHQDLIIDARNSLGEMLMKEEREKEQV